MLQRKNRSGRAGRGSVRRPFDPFYHFREDGGCDDGAGIIASADLRPLDDGYSLVDLRRHLVEQIAKHGVAPTLGFDQVGDSSSEDLACGIVGYASRWHYRERNRVRRNYRHGAKR